MFTGYRSQTRAAMRFGGGFERWSARIVVR
jgi:hypothetical protein